MIFDVIYGMICIVMYCVYMVLIYEWFVIIIFIRLNIFLSNYFRIDYAQPAQTPPYQTFINPTLCATSKSNNDSGKNGYSDASYASFSSITTTNDNLFCVGDHRETATLNGALASGKKAAVIILKSRK